MQRANSTAQRFSHEWIGTEHILLGIVEEGTSVAFNALRNLDVDPYKVAAEVQKIVQPGPEMKSVGKLPLTPRAKKVIGFALEEAKSMAHSWVGSEHLLLGCLREPEGVACQVLINLGVKLQEVRDEVLRLLGVPKEQPELARHVDPPPEQITPLERALRVMERYKDAKFDPVAMADIQQVMAKEIEKAVADSKVACTTPEENCSIVSALLEARLKIDKALLVLAGLKVFNWELKMEVLKDEKTKT